MKKMLALVLALVMVFSLFACTSTPSGNDTTAAPETTKAADETTKAADDGTTAAPATDGNYPKLRLNMTSFTGDPPTHAQEVQDALNAKLIEKGAAAEIEFVWVGFADMRTQLNLLLTGGDDSLDILNSFWYAPIGELVANGQIAPLDDLLKSSGQDILKLYEDYQVVLDCGKVNGVQYGIPTFTAWSSPNIYICFAAEAEGIEMKDIQTIDQLTEVLIKLKEKNPDKYFIPGATEPYWVPKGIDYLGDTNYLGVLMDCTKDTTVTNYYESDYFVNFLNNVKIWKEKEKEHFI